MGLDIETVKLLKIQNYVDKQNLQKCLKNLIDLRWNVQNTNIFKNECASNWEYI